jgi:hypothetical protein
MDPVEVGFYVRLTAWMSSAAFTGALAAFVIGVRRRGRPPVATRSAFLGFLGAHTIHFLTVLWLARATGGQNVRDAGGWVVSAVVAILFYVGSFTVLALWRRRAAGQAAGRRLRVMSHAAVLFIWAIFMGSYVALAVSMPRYVIPVVLMTATVWAYLRLGGWNAMPTGSGPVPAHL